MSSYIDHQSWHDGDSHSWRVDLGRRMDWLYGDKAVRMRSAEFVADLTSWHFLGKPKPPAWEPPEAA